MPESGIRVGLAGLGRHGMRYAQHLLAHDIPGASLVAVHRRQADAGREWARQRGLAFHESIEALAADPAVDAIAAALPPGLHPRVVEAAAAEKKPVLVDKPLAPDGASARRAAEVARAAGIPAMVGQTMRFNSVVQAVRDHLPPLGRLHLIAINNRFEPANRQWFNEPLHGGMVINTGVHGVDLLRFLSGAEVVDARAFSRRIVTPDVDDVFAAILRLEPGGLLCTLDNTWATGGRTGRVEIVGEHGQLVADHIHGVLGEVRGRRMEKLPLPEPVPTVREVLRAFVRTLQLGGAMPVTLEDGVRAVEGAELIARAMVSTSPS